MNALTETKRSGRGRAVLLVGSADETGLVRQAAAGVCEQLAARSWDVESLDLQTRRIASCTGCFECWVRTPGVCRIRDFNRELAQRVIGADLLVLVSRIRFGSYDSEVQGAMEHLIPLISPFFRNADGETHHALRYDRYPSICGLGVLEGDPDEARIFRTRIARNALNFFSPMHASAVIPASASHDEVEGTILELLSALRVSA
jgi:multimeric flavodoxin WrbA